MSKLINLLTLLGLFYFVYWMIKRHFRRRKMIAQGYDPKQYEKQGLRPITILSWVMVVMYGAYLVYFLWLK